MLRQLHSLPGLVAAVLVIVLALSGAFLSISPVQERLSATVPAAGQMSVADLAGKVAQQYPLVEQLQRTPSGSIIVYFRDGDVSGVDLFDPVSGKSISAYESPSIMRWVMNLHRSLLLDTEGRVATGAGAVLMILLAITGALMLAARLGGWRKILGPIRGTLPQRLHSVLSRYAVLGLLLSAMTGIYLSAGSLELIPEALEAEPEFPVDGPLGAPLPVQTLAALQAIDLNDLREMVYPYPGDPADNYSVRTRQGVGFVHASTGDLHSFEVHGTPRKIYELIYMLHTGEGLWWLGLLLGLSALTVPVLAVTGMQIWWKRRRGLPRLAANVAADAADTVILVGTEGNTTWGFARTLHDALTSAGHRVHTAPMNNLAVGINSRYRSAERLFILTATYGDGGPPASGNHFLASLAKIVDTPKFRFAVLGFGDRQFPQFCQFALDVDAALRAKGWTAFCQLELLDRESPQEFARWGKTVGELIGTDLSLEHNPERPHTMQLQLAERVEYATETDTPTTVFRFTAASPGPKAGILRALRRRPGLPYFEAGDLVGILPPGSHVPRFYSLASASKEGMLEICVRKHTEGLCSGYLHNLKSGDTIDAFIKPNPEFRLCR